MAKRHAHYTRFGWSRPLALTIDLATPVPIAIAIAIAVASTFCPCWSAGFFAPHRLPVASRSYSKSSPALSSTRLQDFTELRNSYFALRHGQSLANVEGIIASEPTVAVQRYGLSGVGQKQAEDAGMKVVQRFMQERKAGTTWNGICVLSSDLLRARETANAVVSAIRRNNQNTTSVWIPLYDTDVVIERRLRERGFGQWDLSPDSNYESVWQDDRIDPTHTKFGVESVQSVVDRVTKCVIEWDQKLENQMVILVAHGDVLQILQTCFQKVDSSQHRTIKHLETATLRQLELG